MFEPLSSLKYVSVYFCAGVTANSVHPGVVMTEVMRHYSLLIRCLFNITGIFFFKVSSFVPFRQRSHFCGAMVGRLTPEGCMKVALCLKMAT